MSREKAYTCKVCHKVFPAQYEVKNPGRSRKEYGTKQLMRLHASNNFARHERACYAKHNVCICGGKQVKDWENKGFCRRCKRLLQRGDEGEERAI